MTKAGEQSEARIATPEQSAEMRQLEKKVGAFFYLLNAMENAAAKENPAEHFYFLKRLEVFRHVAKLREASTAEQSPEPRPTCRCAALGDYDPASKSHHPLCSDSGSVGESPAPACEYCMEIAKEDIISDQRDEAIESVLDGGHFKWCTAYSGPATTFNAEIKHILNDLCADAAERVAAPPEPSMTRWEVGVRNIVTILVGPRTEFEISDIVERVRELQAKVLTLEQALLEITNRPCDLSHDIAKAALSGESRQ